MSTSVANGNESASSNKFASDAQWDDLLNLIEQERVIPVIGERVVTSEPKNELWYPQLADLIAERLERRATDAGEGDDNIINPTKFITALAGLREKSKAPGASAPSVNEVAIRWAQAGGNRYLVYQEIKDIVVAKKPNPGPTLRQLAKIRPFKLFITTTFDPLLEEAINSERVGVSPSKASNWIFEKDVEKDLFARKNDLLFPTVCYMLGHYSSTEFVVSEEDALEFVCNLSRSLEKATKLALDLKDNGLLMVGLNFPDWLIRFFLRITKQGRLSEQKQLAQYLAERPPMDPSMTVFLQGTRVRIFEGEPTQFVAELSRRWKDKLLRSPRPDPPDNTSITLGEPEPRIFISYATEDYSAAERFYQRLRENDLPSWLDRDRLKPGDRWPHELRRQVMEKCWVFVSMISKTTETAGEGWFISERNLAIERMLKIPQTEKFYLPVVIDETKWPFKHEPLGAEDLQWTVARDGIPEDGFIALVKDILERRKKSPRR